MYEEIIIALSLPPKYLGIILVQAQTSLALFNKLLALYSKMGILCDLG